MTLQQNKGGQSEQDSNANKGLSGLVAEYWEDKETPKYQGYKASSKSKRLKGKHNLEDCLAESSDSESQDISRGDNNRKRKKTEKSKLFKFLRCLAIILLLFVAVLSIILFLLEWNGKKSLKDGKVTDEKITSLPDAETEDGGKNVIYKGETYCYNDNISTILCIGVDREEYNQNGKYGEGGQADTLFLVAIDSESGKSTMIPISRNTMVEIDEFNEDGTYWRRNEIQIALAYTYGDGKEKSCENVANAVSRLMYGMPVNDYVAIDLSAIAFLNDAVGGVPVTVLEDMTDYDPILQEGVQVTLKGQQAVSYVRSRKVEGYDLEIDNNAARMERQQQYLASFLKTVITQTKSDLSVPLNLYNFAKEDMITSITASEVMYYAKMVTEKGLNNSIVSIPGEAKKGEYTEVYIDDNALYQIILDTFYNKSH